MMGIGLYEMLIVLGVGFVGMLFPIAMLALAVMIYLKLRDMTKLLEVMAEAMTEDMDDLFAEPDWEDDYDYEDDDEEEPPF